MFSKLRYFFMTLGNPAFSVIRQHTIPKDAGLAGFYCIKIYNHLPRELKQLSNDQKSFGLALKRFLFVNSFYSMNEYFNYKCTHI
jgi:hypothetical protein